MKYLPFIMVLPVCIFLVACSGTDSKTGDSGVDSSLEDPSAIITHEDGWTIVSKVENGDRVYWFLAPDVDDVSSAMFKKTIYSRKKTDINNSDLETETVSQCDASRQTCDDLMKKFNKLSEKYK